MRKSRLIGYTVILTAAAIFAGCGKDKENTEDTVNVTEAEFATETTVTEEPEIEHDGYYNDLTGEWNTDRTEEYGRPISVMINNIGDAIPQAGIAEADIIYEFKVEGGITRLLAFYSEYENIEKLGSVRSCRPYYVTESLEFDAIYVHYGQSPQGEEILASSGIDHLSGLDAEGSTVFYRASDKVAPHNVYTNGEMLLAGIEYKNYSTEHDEDFESKFSFNEEVETPSGGETANKITTTFNSSRAPWFEYNSNDGLYYRFQYGTEHIDENTGEQIAFENIIIQFAHYTSIDDHDRQEIDLVTSGDGLYASDGVIIPITWKKSSSGSQTKYYTEDGNELILNPGKTWVTVFEEDEAENVTWE